MRENIIRSKQVSETNSYRDISESQSVSLKRIQLNKEELDQYLKQISSKDIKFLSMSGKITGEKATYSILIEETISETTVERKRKIQQPIKVRADLHIEDGIFLALSGEKMQPGKFYFVKALLNGEVVELPINVKRVVEGLSGLYQIVTDEDGDWGYNV